MSVPDRPAPLEPDFVHNLLTGDRRGVSGEARDAAWADELLAAIERGGIRIGDLSTSVLEELRSAAGGSAIAEAVAASPAVESGSGSTRPLGASDGTLGRIGPYDGSGSPPSAGTRRGMRLWPALAAAAAVLIAVGAWQIDWRSATGSTSDRVIDAPGWPETDFASLLEPPVWGELAVAAADGATIGDFRALPAEPDSPDFLPIFGPSSFATMGRTPAPTDAEYWRQATVIVRVESGHGSGALVSADGLILTNYHNIADVVQSRALRGETALVSVILPEIVDGMLRPRADRFGARVVRVDPAADLALLKLESPPDDLVHFVLGESVPQYGTRCHAIGSAAGLPAWLLREATLLGTHDFPGGLTDMVVLADQSARTPMTRERPRVIVSSAQISGGDSGGPLLTSDGTLVGLTFATPSNFTRGSIGLHIELSHLRSILENVPAAPEVVPPDLWTAAMAGVQRTGPQVATTPSGHVAGLRFVFRPARSVSPDKASPLQLGSPVAVLEFVADPEHPMLASALSENPAASIPTGLWHMEDLGAFRWLVAVLQTAHGDIVVARAGPNGDVVEMLTGSADSADARLVFERRPDSTWTVRPAPPGLSLLEADSAHAAKGVTEKQLK